MKVLITGGAGFIGHNVALHLEGRGYDVSIVDSMERSSKHALRRLEGFNVRVVRADVRTFSNYGHFDAVVHAAAYVSVEESLREPLKYIENNSLGTARVGYECARGGLKLIYLSSAAVYGEPLKLPVDEEHPTSPLSPYGLSKLYGEEILRNFARTYGLKHVTLRLFNVYGPGQNPAYAGVITNFMERALKGEPLIIHGDGEQTRDFIYVGDVAKIIECLIERDLFDNQTYNIGSGRPTTINQLATTIRNLINKGLAITYAPARPGDIRHSVANVGRVRKLINIQTISLEEGLKKTLDQVKRDLQQGG
ncbi:MAG: NAD-dependent epimerase/dehydratase family protein [Zestosphaera sp.]